MIDFPIDELLDEEECTKRLERRLHPEGLKCPRCQASDEQRNNTDEWQGYAQVEAAIGIAHVTVRHGQPGASVREWARDDDGDGIREVHCNGCEGAGAPLRTFLRIFRGVHKKFLADYVATFETMTNAEKISAEIIRRMCFTNASSQSKET